MPLKHTRGPLVVEEIDGIPTGTPVILKFSTDTITDNGDGTFSINIAVPEIQTQTDTISYSYFGGY